MQTIGYTSSRFSLQAVLVGTVRQSQESLLAHRSSAKFPLVPKSMAMLVISIDPHRRCVRLKVLGYISLDQFAQAGFFELMYKKLLLSSWSWHW